MWLQYAEGTHKISDLEFNKMLFYKPLDYMLFHFPAFNLLSEK